jgi:hypothetical protein
VGAGKRSTLKCRNQQGPHLNQTLNIEHQTFQNLILPTSRRSMQLSLPPTMGFQAQRARSVIGIESDRCITQERV